MTEVKTKTIIKVGIADLKITSLPNHIKTYGLGSCVGVVIYDKTTAGLAHVMLPDSKVSAKSSKQNQMKYADTAIDLMMEQLLQKGVQRKHLQAKIAGGAHMFSFQTDQSNLKIGERNTEAVLQKLSEYKIPVVAQDVGGNKGRTIEFHIETGLLEIRTIHSGVTFI